MYEAPITSAVSVYEGGIDPIADVNSSIEKAVPRHVLKKMMLNIG